MTALAHNTCIQGRNRLSAREGEARAGGSVHGARVCILEGGNRAPAWLRSSVLVCSVLLAEAPASAAWAIRQQMAQV